MAASYVGSLRNGIRDIHKSFIARDIKVADVCKESIKLINENKNLNPFITVCAKDALDKANQLDESLSAKDRKEPALQNPLYGVPISIKDNFCTNQVLTTCGSKMLYNFIPPYTATAVSKLLKANCIMMGKTNMDEFAMGSSSTTSYYGPTANHWKRELLDGANMKECKPDQWYMAGGSSTGSAVSVASGSCFASLGTDTGGSTRQPASFTGIVGFKPTYGLISRFGLIPLVHCLDVVSILTRTVQDARLIFETVVGQDENDLTTVDHKSELKQNFQVPEKGVRTIRVGIPEEFIEGGSPSKEVANVYSKVLSNLPNDHGGNIKFELVRSSLPHSSLSTECYTIISSAEIASNMSCYDGVKYGLVTELGKPEDFDRDKFYRANRDEGFGLEVKKRILLGNYFLLSENKEKYLVQAMKLRRLISNEFAKVFESDKVDIILMPSTPTTSLSYANWLEKQDDNRLFREDYFLIPSNLANLPSISLPADLSSNGLPLGLQLVSNKYHDLDLLTISEIFENLLLKLGQ